MHIENAQVCSEMTSVELEEQLDKEVFQKKEIQDQCNEIVKENENLLEKIETINKEKQELTTKLENYMQENMDLIDRLEKLSAEKVSSAESIEIVESLTQQEKLEIEAYQKNLEFIPDAEEKPSHEHITDLHEDNDVKLTEETSPVELLERIELFTVERREVMEKMDSLATENQQLISKLERYESEKSNLEDKYDKLTIERDSLTNQWNQLLSDNKKLKSSIEKADDESSEKLQEEIAEYRALLENQKLQIASLQEELWNKPDSDTEATISNKTEENTKLKELNNSLSNQLRTLQMEYEALFNSQPKLEEEIKYLENELIKARNKIIELEDKLEENIEEITFLESNIEETKEEIIRAATSITEHAKSIEEKNLQIEIYKNQIEELQTIVHQEFPKIENFKKLVDENNQKLKENNETIDELQDQIEELTYQIMRNQQNMELKDEEISTLSSQKQILQLDNDKLQNELSQKNNQFTQMVQQLKTRCETMQKQIESNTGSLEDMKAPFEAKIFELTSKNKELIEKMKKIAANLKKKTATCQELESQLMQVQEKWENENKEKDEKQSVIEKQNSKLAENEVKITSLVTDLQELEVEYSKLRENQKEIRNNYELQLKDLEEEKVAFEKRLEANYTHLRRWEEEAEKQRVSFDILLQDVTEKEQQIENLNYELNRIRLDLEGTNSKEEQVQRLLDQLQEMRNMSETYSNAMQAKLQEKDMYIENIESECNKYKQKASKLEEYLSTFEEKKQMLEEKALNLSVQLKESTSACAEASQTEDFLEQRLSSLLARDKIIEKQLENYTLDNQNLNDRVKTLMEENEEVQSKLHAISIKLHESSKNVEKLEVLDQKCVQLQNIINQLENELKKEHSEAERKVNEKNMDMENMETEFNTQMEELSTEKKNILNHCEMLQDRIKEYSENELLLNDEINQLKNKLNNINEELSHKISESSQLEEANSNSVLKIQELENTVANLQNHTFIPHDSLQATLTNLQKVVQEKDVEIQNYQRQNMQLQMAASFSAPTSTASLFDSPQPDREILLLKKSLDESNISYSSLEQQFQDISQQLNNARTELAQSQEKLAEILQKYEQASMEIDVQQKCISNLQTELETQAQLFVRHTAEKGVTEIIAVAEQIVSEKPIVEEVMMQKESQITSEKSGRKMTEEENKEELLRKIKALEFMLFNIEREKDDTMEHCHEFTNELMRLVYERENILKTKRDTVQKQLDPFLEDQIISLNVNVEQCKNQLHNLEFTPLNLTPGVTEDIIQPKTAYLCYGEQIKDPPPIPQETSGWGAEDTLIQESIEAQIVQMDQVPISPEERKEFQQFEYGCVQLPKDVLDHSLPINETIPDPKSAYLCYPSEGKNVLGEDTFASEEDGWGWNAEEVKLEAEHRQTLSAVLQEPVVDSRIDQLEERIHDLEVERSRLLEEIKTLQIRSGKLIKKLKMLKEENDKLNAASSRQKSFDDFGLDMAIQEELNNQIKTLEKKIKELSEENSKDKAEKENLLKRLDVLQSANERMIENKEKTDNELQFLQFKNRELSSKLEQLEWGDESPLKIKSIPLLETSHTIEDQSEYKKKYDELNTKVVELNTTINDLTLDNEEMQLLLEEQRNLRIKAEKALLNLPVPENMKPEHEFAQIEKENKNLTTEIINLTEMKSTLEQRLSQFVQSNDELNARATHLQLNVENLMQENNMMNNQFTARIEQLQNENIELQQEIRNMNVDLLRQQLQTSQLEIAQLKECITSLEGTKNEMQQTYNQKENEMKSYLEFSQTQIQQLQEQLTVLENEKQIMQASLLEKENVIFNLNTKIEQLEAEKTTLDSRLQEILNIQNADKSNDEKLREMNEQLVNSLTELETKNKDLADLNNTLSVQKLETEQKSAIIIEQLAQEWSERVDQRGNDVAESWKLHLDSVETEFSQKEEKLKAELNEIFSKNEEIIQQNNELQQQVEILISEKQSFVTDNNSIIQSLQQNVNNKQSEMSQMVKKLEEVGAKLEIKNNEIMALKQSSELLQLKDLELQEAGVQLEEKLHECKELENELIMKNNSCQLLENKLREMQVLSDEEANQINDLKNMIENHVLKIEELKNQLQEKKEQFDGLVIEYTELEKEYLKGSANAKKNTEESEFATEAQILYPENQMAKIEVDSDSAMAPVNRAELDLALYMLHQRDVRCEELTVELMQLLEERDTLQLKLSNAIRQNEDLRSKPAQAEEEFKRREIAAVSTGAIPKTKTIILGATGTELATEVTEAHPLNPSQESDSRLGLKLSELRTVGYRDKTLKDDQESRYIQQMSILQDHKDLAAKLPPEAAARLVDANYTLCKYIFLFSQTIIV